jgi:hypothetical protein
MMFSNTHKAASAPLHKAISVLLVAITTITSSLGALAAPAGASLAQESSAQVTPDAPARRLFMPALRSDRKPTETFEVDIVRLDQAQSQTQSSKPENGPQIATEDGFLPAPAPGEELYPAQPDVDSEPAAAPSSVDAPQSLDATVTVVQEDFEGTFPTGSWRVLDYDGEKNGEYYWDDDDYTGYNSKQSAWVANGGWNGLDPAFYNYPNHLHTWMIYGPFDLSDASAASLTFQYWNRSEINYDFLGWYASSNGNDFYGYRVSGDSLGWKPMTLDLKSVPALGNVTGDSSVWIAFRFISDGNTTDRGAFLDQIRVQKEVNANCAGEFKAEYFNNKELSGTPLFTRCEKPPINHNWGNSGPGNGIGNDNFSVRWTGTFDFDQGNYNFVAIADDGVRVWLDNTQILNNWKDQGLTPNFATRRVSDGDHTIRIEYYEHEGGAAAQFRWLESDTVVSTRHAFDTCFLPHPSEMQNWWGNSPYYEIGIYIGGSNRGCRAHNEQYLTASWIATVRQQGWNFIPTWVGPQAPCTTQNFYTMSSDPEIAFAEGRHEAGNAAEAAQKLGLTTQDMGGTIIYYDMEPYPNNGACREAVKSFMAGWASRLHELGNQAGGYGAACASYITDWVLEAPYTVDQIWPAAWIYPSYNPDATVWDVSCIDNSLWSNQQRIRQYAGDHNERWGSITLNIDSNIVNGQVAGTIPHAASAEMEQQWRPVHITDMQLVAENEGWIIAQGQLLWSEDGGATWANRSPVDLQLDVRAAQFLDSRTGWLVGAGLPDAQGRSMLYVGKSADAGMTWQLRGLQEFNPVEPGSTQGAVTLNVFDANTAYMQIKLASSSNFDLYATFKTLDGGATWQEILVPGNSPVHFADALIGWTVATTTDAPVQMTTDGGATWRVADQLPALAASAEIAIMASAAEMGAVAATSLDNGTSWIFVERGLCSGEKQADATEAVASTGEPFDCLQYTALMRTTDGGATWIDITPAVE